MFRVFSSSDLGILENDMALFSYHITMSLNLLDSYDSQEAYESRSLKVKTRINLESKLLISNQNFLKKAEETMKSWATEVQERKKQFRELIMSPNTVNLEQVTVEPSLYLFLYSLCCVKAEKTLSIFVKKYSDVIKRLTDKEFDSICVVAAFNHLPRFISFLCTEGRRQGREIDNYSIEPYSDHSLWICCVTPFIAAVLGLCDNPHNWTKEKIGKATEVVNILLANQANPHKKYVVDDVSEDEIAALLNDDKYSYTVFQTVIEGTSSSDPQLNELSKENKEAYAGFIEHIKHCSPSLSYNYETMTNK